MKRSRKKRGVKIDRRLLILFAITPVGCLLAIFVGLIITWYLFPTRFVDAQISELSEDQAQEIVVMTAADFAEHQDVERAKTFLAELQVPNTAQYVSLVAERMIRTNRGPVDEEIKNVVNLAEALGVSTISMIAYVSTPTATPTETPLPTSTPTNTPVVPTATPTLVVQAAAGASAENIPPTEEPPPTETALPEPVATHTPAPPTDTPTPEPTPTPAVDFVITQQRLLSKDENGGCLGMHSIFVNVVDAAGNPIKGVELGDAWNAVPGVVTGHKGDDQPGLAVYDLYKNGYMIFVKNDPTAGRPVTSEQTELLSSNDWEIGIPRLIEAGYCPDEATCRVLWNSGVYGEGNNSLCWGHYSWEVTFQRTW
ncbi:MAG: hypothetical protein JW953_21605 [Anaerolineae bacterium]|nr:hypothetical protein [Anaerolineae bacterium]